MGRKRLLTILAAVTAAVTLQVGPAAADHCLDRGDLSLTEFLGLADDVCVVDADGKLLQGTLDHATEPVEETTEKTVETTTDTVKTTTDTVKKTTDTVEDTTKKVTDTVTGGSPAPTEPPPTDPPPSTGGNTGGDSDGGAPGDDTSSSGGQATADRSSGVSASGEARRPVASDPARDSQLAALRAIREDLAASSWDDRGMAGPVSPFGGLSDTSLDLAAPEVAGSGVEPEFGDRLTPEVAVASDDEDALLATSEPVDLAEAPLALKLLAAALVLGAGAVWTIASRELGQGSAGSA
jgi:hypothetical protein